MKRLERETPVRHARILGVGAYRPERSVDNAEVCALINSSDAWVQSRSGIRTRGFAGPHETLEMMATAAAGKALAAAGIEPADVDCVLVSTISHLRQLPGMAPDLAVRIGAGGVGAFDVSAACAGGCYGLALADSMVRGGNADHVVVVGAERMRDIIDAEDRSLAFLFADGAAAWVVGPSDEPGIGPVAWGSDGDSLDALTMTRTWGEFRDDPALPSPVLYMDGRRVFRWTAGEIAKVCQAALDKAGVTAADLGAFIPHQANLRITEVLANDLRLPEHVAIADDVVTSGNTSSASIPLAMEALLSSGRASSGDLALLAGFGAGLAYAAQVVVLP